MRFLFYSVLFLLMSSTLSAQYLEQSDSVRLMKNTLGVVFNPLAAIALGSDPNGLHYGIQYKRLLANNKRFRSTVLFQRNSSDDSPGYPISSTDSSVTFNSKQSSYKYGELRLGLEWSDYREKHDGVFGFDIIAGYDVTRDEEHVKVHREDNAPADGEHSYYVFSDTIANNRVEHSLVLGMSAVIGYRVLMKEKWELMAVCTPEIMYYVPLKAEGLKYPGMDSNASSLVFRMRLLDLVFSYSF